MSKASVTRPCHRSQSHVAEHRGWGLGWHGRLAGRCRGGCTCPTNGMETTYQVRLGGTIAYTPLRAASRNLHGPTHQRPLDRRRMAAAQHLQTHMPQSTQSRDNGTAFHPPLPTPPPHPLLPLAHSPAPLGCASPGGAAPSSLPSPLPSSPSCRVASTGRSRTASRARSRDPAPRPGEASPPLDAPMPTRDCKHKGRHVQGTRGGQEGER
jgi:hypothetical protein